MIQIQEYASLLNNNTFGIDATTRYYAEYSNIQDLRDILKWKQNNAPRLPLLKIGRGSNLLFTQPVYEGVVIKAKQQKVDEIRCEGNNVTVWAGVLMDDFIAWCIDQALYGLENLSWIPGTVGASAVQNIGAYGTEVSRYIKSVRCLNAKTCEERLFAKEECQYTYRDSIFKHRREWIVTDVTYCLSDKFSPILTYGNLSKVFESQNPTAALVRQAVINTRIAKLPNPKTEGNAGSFFMNPIVSQEDYERIADNKEIPHYPALDGYVKLSAAWLIEQTGWKGRSLGAAAVSEKHALILVNKGGAKGIDIVNLCSAIQTAVYNKFSVLLRPEVNFV